MKPSSKLNRKQLALRLFGGAVILNGLLLFCFLPAESKQATQKSLPEGYIELKISASLFTTFEAHKKVLLSQGPIQVGPVLLLDHNDEKITVALSSELYRQNHKKLSQEAWAALPYLDGMQPVNLKRGINYEIAY